MHSMVGVNNEIIKNLIIRLGDGVDYDQVSELLPKLIAEQKIHIDTSTYLPANSEPYGMGRFLLYDHADKSHPFSIWAFAFGCKQKTCIHDHQFKGTVIVLEGPVSEKFYRPSSQGTAQLIERSDRYRFHCNKDELSDTFVHQLKRRKALGEGVSVTLHIYNMEAAVVRNISQVYNKVESQDKPDYLELRP